ncbi:MAG: hypothetical protein LBT04_07825 [Prevotellaceae bacterium]|jgi:hypothetical protein|nr:hypothetical protein [Prevotellaceae bacterium]
MKQLTYRPFMCEYMHVHIEDGAIFKYEDVVFGEMARLDKYDGLVFFGGKDLKEPKSTTFSKVLKVL